MNREISKQVSFDQYQRYRTIAEIVNFFRSEGGKSPFRILEIGANEHKDMSLFLPEDKILYTDVILTEGMRQDSDFQQADGTNLPYSNREFDFVYSCDVLEHIAKEKRLAFLSETMRVAKQCAILCFPYFSQAVMEAEERVNAYYYSLTGENFIWLKEHRDNGLPDTEAINAFFNDLGLHFYSFYHGDVLTWEKLWCCKFDASFAPDKEKIEENIDYLYNHNLYRYDVSKNCYRIFYIISHFELPQIKGHMQDFWFSGSSWGEDVLEILRQACSQVHPLRKCIQGLENQVLTSRKTIEEKNRQINLASCTIDRKEAEIAEARSTIECQRIELGKAQETITKKDKEIESARKTIEEKDVEIVSARETLASLEEQINFAKITIDKQNGEIENARKTIEEKDVEIGSARESLTNLEKQIISAKAAMDDQEKQIEAARKTIEEKDAEIEAARRTIAENNIHRRKG